LIAGVDGHAGRWILVTESDRNGTRIDFASSIEEILTRFEPRHVVIDVPIGLPAACARQCDRLARRRIGGRRSSVFPAPVRGVLDATSYEELCERWMEIDGRKASRQLWAILPLIRSVDASMTPDVQRIVREGHPELSFAEMKGAPLCHSKKSAAGVIERLDLLQRRFPDATERLRGMEVAKATGDAIDAYALLWTARRWRDGRAETIPAEPQLDERGLRMEMIC